MNNIEIAKQTLRIIEDGKYEFSGEMIYLPQNDYEKVMVYSPMEGKNVMDRISKEIPGRNEELCKITITSEDSFQAAGRYKNVLVMNFANAHIVGGGFKLGATAQEEALCRCSTLYASISSKKASEMYQYNNTHLSGVESDYMLLSPNVCVFRDERCVLLKEPKVVSVITLPAPNKYGAAMLVSSNTIETTMTRRIRIMLSIAADNGYKNLVLGAWGCGAFGNKPENVSRYFKKVIVEEGYGKYFDEVCFAIYGSEDGKNITAFVECFNN